MDTGNNGQMLAMNIEAIAEVKVLTQGYQAEYGRSSGLQITAVTKSGTNRFRGSVYDVDEQLRLEREHAGRTSKNGDAEGRCRRTRRWATRSAARSASPAATTSCSSSTATSIVRRRRRSTAATRSASVPTALERAGRLLADARQQRRALQPDPQLRAACRARRDSRLLSGRRRPRKIPASALYRPGLAILNRYPLPNITQAPGTNYNYQIDRCRRSNNLTQQPAVRAGLPDVAEVARHRQVLWPARSAQLDARPGTIPGFNDVLSRIRASPTTASRPTTP